MINMIQSMSGIIRKRRDAGGGPAPEASLTDQAFVSFVGSTAAYTLTNRAIGAEDAGRRVVVAFAQGNGTDPSAYSVTIGGVSADIHVQRKSGSQFRVCCIASAIVPTGATASIVLTTTASIQRRGLQLAVFRLVGFSGTALDTYSASAPSPSDAMTTVEGGIIIGAAAASSTDGSISFTAGLAEIAEGAGAFNDTVATAATLTGVTGPTTTVSATLPSLTDRNCFAAASFGPA